MKAVVYRGPRDLPLEERVETPLKQGDIRVAVERVGVCGTDVRIFKGEHSAYAGVVDRVPGHEIVGRVVETSDRYDGRNRVGGLVFVAPNVGCGSCRQCTVGNENLCPTTEGIGITFDGGFAESLVIPVRAAERGNLIPLEGVGSVDASVLIEPLACVLRGQQKVDVHPGDTVVVCGGGPIGLLHVALAVLRGAALVICSEPAAPRRAAAKRAGAGIVVDPLTQDLASVVAQATRGAGADVVITAAPVHAIQSAAVEMTGPGGRILLFGGLPSSRPTVELDTNAIHYKELTVVGTTASTLDDCRRAAELVRDGRIETDGMVSDVFALGDFAAAIAGAQDASALKVVIDPSK